MWGSSQRWPSCFPRGPAQPKRLPPPPTALAQEGTSPPAPTPAPRKAEVRATLLLRTPKSSTLPSSSSGQACSPSFVAITGKMYGLTAKVWVRFREASVLPESLCGPLGPFDNRQIICVRSLLMNQPRADKIHYFAIHLRRSSQSGLGERTVEI